MSMVYSRDGASASILVLDPDVTRSGRIVEATLESSAENPKETAVKMETEAR